MAVTAISNQTLVDLAIQESGDASGALELALINDISITDDLDSGLRCTTGTVLNQDVLDYLKNNSVRPASNDFHNYEEDQEGIGFWIIEQDFIVS